MLGGKKVVVVMPAYNAEKTMEDVFRKIPKAVYRELHSILVVNDGSTDGTEKEARRLSKTYKKIKLINHEMNKGYAQAQKTAYDEALRIGADVAIMLHSDGQYAPEMLGDMLLPLVKGKADVVMGSRMLNRREALKGSMPLYKYLGNKFLTGIENLAYGMNLSEYHTGYMAYSSKALRTIPYRKLSDTFHIDGEMLLVAGKKKLRICEVAIPTKYAEEVSYLNPISYGFNVLKVVFNSLIGKYDF